MNYETEQVKLALKHLENIKRFTRDVQDSVIHQDTHKNAIIGLTEIILRLDDAIEDLQGVKLSDDHDGLQLEVVG